MKWIASVVTASALTVLPVVVCGPAGADDPPDAPDSSEQSSTASPGSTSNQPASEPTSTEAVEQPTQSTQPSTPAVVAPAASPAAAQPSTVPTMRLAPTTKPAAPSVKPTTVKPKAAAPSVRVQAVPTRTVPQAVRTAASPVAAAASPMAAPSAAPSTARLPAPVAPQLTITPAAVPAVVFTPPRLVTVVSKRLEAVVSNVLASLHDVFAFKPTIPAPGDCPLVSALLAFTRRREVDQDLEQSSFGRMFPGLPALNQQSNQQLADLAQTMLEPAAIANPKGTSAGITFFGQFIDHDLTADPAAQPTAPIDPTTLKNGRTFAFDLDSVYGGGPTVSPQLYDASGRFKLGVATDGVSPDLPRNPDGSAILVEPRNDENQIISQIHVSFLRLHNELMDQGMTYQQAHDTVVNAYRYVVINDYLPQIVGQPAVDKALATPLKKGFYDPGNKDAPVTPVEFSVAAFRFGHSQVRAAYNINDQSGGVQIFSLDPNVADLRGGRQLSAARVIDFDNFFPELPRDNAADPAALIGRAIDTNISPGLFALPIPGAEASGSNVLGFRNMLRAKFYDMPSYEAVAAAMGLPVVGSPVFPQGTPLWYGILREAQLSCGADHHLCAAGEQGGGELGPVGSGIVAEVFVDVMRLSTTNGNAIVIRTPNVPDATGGDFRIGDLLVAADVLAAVPV